MDNIGTILSHNGFRTSVPGNVDYDDPGRHPFKPTSINTKFLREHSSRISARKRTAPAEPEHFKSDPPYHPIPPTPQHQKRIKRGQRTLGGLLWLSTCATPDLAFTVSSAAQILNKFWHCFLPVKRQLTLLFLLVFHLHLLGNTPRRAIPLTVPSAMLGIFSIGSRSEDCRKLCKSRVLRTSDWKRINPQL